MSAPPRLPSAVDSYRVGGTYNVLGYGLVGDGVTDNTAKMRALVVATGSTGHASYLFPPGTYKFVCPSGQDAVTIPSGASGLHIVGAGEQATTIAVAGDPAKSWLTYSGTGQCSVRKMTIGAGVTKSVGAHEISVSSSFYWIGEDLIFSPQGGQGWGAINFSSPSGSPNSGGYMSRVDANEYPRYFTGSNFNDFYVGDSIAFWAANPSAGTAMIDLSNKVEAFCIRPHVDIINASGQSGGCCMHIHSAGVRYNKFTGTFFDSAESGVIHDAGSLNSFTDCWFSNRPGTGLTVNGGYKVRVIGGECENGGAAGIALLGGSKHKIIGMAFSALGQTTPSPAIHVGGSVSGFIITGNDAQSVDPDGRFSGNITAGILIDSGATSGIVSDNDFAGCTASVTNNSGSGTVHIGTNL